MHVAWTLLNDIMSSSQITSTKPELVAAACLFVGLTISNCHQEDAFESTWYKPLGITEDELLLACNWVVKVWECKKEHEVSHVSEEIKTEVNACSQKFL